MENSGRNDNENGFEEPDLSDIEFLARDSPLYEPKTNEFDEIVYLRDLIQDLEQNQPNFVKKLFNQIPESGIEKMKGIMESVEELIRQEENIKKEYKELQTKEDKI